MRRGLLLFIPALFLSCMDPLSFDPENIKLDVDLHGNINTTDVTSAVLLLINQSKTVNVTDVEIRQAGSDDLIVSFQNEPQRLTKRARYLTPSEESYTVHIEYDYYFRGGEPGKPLRYEGRGEKDITVALPLPREIVDVFIYRDMEGKVQIDIEKRGLNFDPDDTGDPLDDTLVGQGSSPAVIPPENRSRMAAFVVINRTRSQNIDSVRFQMGQSAYTMGTVRVRDKQSIALGQGTWETKVSYTRNETGVTLPVVNSIIVPSNDPQAVGEHYLHFYLNNKGQYDITEDWPPGDESEEDILPPDQGHGRGVIKIVNHSDSLVNNVAITNRNDQSELKIGFDSTAFDPPVPVVRGRIGYIDLVGTGDFPIDGHNKYHIDVTVKAGDSEFTITMQTRLKDVVVEIVIEPEDIVSSGILPPVEGTPQADGTLRIINQTSFAVASVTIKNEDPGDSLEITSGEFMPPGDILHNQDARIYATGTEAFPIAAGAEYTIVVVMGNGTFTEWQAVIKDAYVVIIITPEETAVVTPVPPPDYGRGAIMIVNHSNSPVNSLTITLPGGSFDPMSFNGSPFPIPVNKTARIDVMGTAASPIEAGTEYRIEVTAGILTVEKQTVIKDSLVTITVENPKVYAVGWYNGESGFYRYACYWLDGNRINLRPFGAGSSGATGVAVSSNGTIYISGWYSIQTDWLEYPRACYWIVNGTTFNRIDLHPAGYEEHWSKATGIVVTDNGDVHIAGKMGEGDYDIYQDSTEDISPYGGTACYWKNGVRQPFPNTVTGGGNVTGSAALAITADGSDVYIAGWYSDEILGNYWDTYNDYYAFYWRAGSGSLTRLSLPANDNYQTERYAAHAITVSGGVVYTAGKLRGSYDIEYGSDDNTAYANYQLCYWKDNTPVILNTLYPDEWDPEYFDCYNAANAAGIAVYGGEVYVAGWWGDDYNPVAGYWKNGTRIPLPYSEMSQAYAITVSGGDIYIAGYSSYNYHYYETAGYWKNGVPERLDNFESAALGVIIP